MRKDISKLENVQSTFTRIVFYRIFPSKEYPRAMPDYKTRLEILKLKTLYYRRIQADVVMGFKILRGEVSLRPSMFWTLTPTSSRRFSLNLTDFRLKGWRLGIFQQSFSSRVSRLLNKLPEDLVCLDSSVKLRSRLARVDLLRILNLDDLGLV